MLDVVAHSQLNHQSCRMWLCFAQRVNLVGNVRQDSCVCSISRWLPIYFWGTRCTRVVHSYCSLFKCDLKGWKIGLVVIFGSVCPWLKLSLPRFRSIAFCRLLCFVVGSKLSLLRYLGVSDRNLRQMLLLILNSIITHVVCGLALPEGLIWFGNGHDSCVCLSLDCYEDFLGDIVCTCRTFICDLAFL